MFNDHALPGPGAEPGALLVASGDALLRAILENSREAIGVHIAGEWVFTNPAAVALFGAGSAEAIVGTPLIDWVAESERDCIRGYMEAREAGREVPCLYVTRCRRADGVEFDAEVHVSSFELQGRGHVVVTVRDVTQTLQAQRDLRESEERYRVLVTETPDAIFIHQGERIVFANPAGVKLLGASKAEDLIGTPVMDRVHPDSRGVVVRRVREGILSGKPVPMLEEKFLKLDGTPIDVEVVGNALTVQGEPCVQVQVRDISERKRTEKIEREAQLRRRAIIETAMDGFWLVDDEGRIKEVNEAYCRLSGFAADEIVGKSITDFEAGESPSEVTAHMRKIADKGQDRFETQHRRKDGSLCDVEVTVQYRVDQEGGERVAFLRDITEQKAAEQALLAREADYRALFENMHSGFMLFELIFDESGAPTDHRLLLANREFETQTGLDRYSQVGRTSKELLFSWPPELTQKYYGIAMNGGTLHLERFNELLDRWYDIRAFSAGESRFALLFNDISDRKRAEEALRQREVDVRRRLTNILAPVAEAGEFELADIIDADAVQKLMDECYAITEVPISILDRQGRRIVGTEWQDVCLKFHRAHPVTLRNCMECDTTLHDNAREGEFYSYWCKNGLRDCATPLVIGGRHVGNVFTGQFFFEGERPSEEAFRERAAEYGFDEEAYVEAYRKVPTHDRPRIERVFKFYMQLAQMISALSHANLTLAKMAERAKQSEAHINELNETLERRVEQRTAELRAAVEEIDSFSYSVSHDLRAPLRAVDGYCKILSDDYGDQLDADARDMLLRMRDAAQRMGHLIEGLLALTRLSRSEFNPEVLDITAVAESVADRLRSAEPDRRVVCRIERGLRAFGDPALVEAVLNNLLANAWKYTGHRQDARVEVGSVEENGRRAFFVRDNGAGFDETYASKLFKPFERLHSVDEYPGNGIGLASAKRIVTRHGGAIWGTGKVGEGATFYFTLGEGLGGA